jgi:delta 1-pyrroline-5-carboxylate dehydrogenase
LVLPFGGDGVCAYTLAAAQIAMNTSRLQSTRKQARLWTRIETPTVAILHPRTGRHYSAMIVDSSALPEQVVHDAITSAFNSAAAHSTDKRTIPRRRV